MLVFLKAFCIGLFAAYSAGPVFLYLIYISSAKGAVYGYISSLGLALADCTLFFLALNFNSLLLQQHNAILHWAKFGASLFFITAGIYLLTKKTPSTQNQIICQMQKISKTKTTIIFLSKAFLLTILNPFNIIFFTTITFNFFSQADQMILPSLSLGLGSFCSFSTISYISSKITTNLSNELIHKLKNSFAIIIIFLGFFALHKL